MHSIRFISCTSFPVYPFANSNEHNSQRYQMECRLEKNKCCHIYETHLLSGPGAAVCHCVFNIIYAFRYLSKCVVLLTGLWRTATGVIGNALEKRVYRYVSGERTLECVCVSMCAAWWIMLSLVLCIRCPVSCVE